MKPTKDAWQKAYLEADRQKAHIFRQKAHSKAQKTRANFKFKVWALIQELLSEPFHFGNALLLRLQALLSSSRSDAASLPLVLSVATSLTGVRALALTLHLPFFFLTWFQSGEILEYCVRILHWTPQSIDWFWLFHPTYFYVPLGVLQYQETM